MPGRLVHIPLWWVVVGIATTILTPIFTIWASVQINMRTIEQGNQARAEAVSASTQRYCRLIGSQIDVYAEAQTAVGRDAYRVWLTEYQSQGCLPLREK
jgi:hypothetical protein